MSPGLTSVARDLAGGVLRLTIDRPRSANAIDGSVTEGLVEGLGEAAADPAVRAVVLTGAGERVFSGGVDLRADSDQPAFELSTLRAGRLLRCLEALLGFPKPLVTAVNGVAIGGGAMLAILGDRIFCAEQAAFVLPEIDLGMPSFIGLEVVTWVAGENLAAELILTGRRLPAQEAGERRVVHRVLSAADLPAAAAAEAAMLGAKPGFAYNLIKSALGERRRERLARAFAETEQARPHLIANAEERR